MAGKKLENKELEYLLSGLRQNSEKSSMKYQQLTTSQLKEMQDSGITIANHSNTRRMFNNCTREKLEEELTKSEEQLRNSNFEAHILVIPLENTLNFQNRFSNRTISKWPFYLNMKLITGNFTRCVLPVWL